MFEARDDAVETVKEYLDEIIEQILDDKEASDDLLNDYPNGDSWHHENHVDKYYNLQEAAHVLTEYRNDIETDSGLWEGLEPTRAICAQAAYTYGNAVYTEWRDLIKEINDLTWPEKLEIETDCAFVVDDKEDKDKLEEISKYLDSLNRKRLSKLIGSILEN